MAGGREEEGRERWSSPFISTGPAPDASNCPAPSRPTLTTAHRDLSETHRTRPSAFDHFHPLGRWTRTHTSSSGWRTSGQTSVATELTVLPPFVPALAGCRAGILFCLSLRSIADASSLCRFHSKRSSISSRLGQEERPPLACRRRLLRRQPTRQRSARRPSRRPRQTGREGHRRGSSDSRQTARQSRRGQRYVHRLGPSSTPRPSVGGTR